jgi:hypothetical protein
VHRADFFLKSKYVIVSAVTRKVVVVNYSLDSVANRVINVGFDMIGDVLLMPI